MKRIWIILVLVIVLISPVFADVKTSVGGLIEVGYEKIEKEKGKMSAGDIEVAIEAKLNDKISGNVLLRPDAEAENNGDILDEVGITLENFSQMPVSLYVGKVVMPFGVFNSHLISDPWTLENDIIRILGGKNAYTRWIFRTNNLRRFLCGDAADMGGCFKDG